MWIIQIVKNKNKTNYLIILYYIQIEGKIYKKNYKETFSA